MRFIDPNPITYRMLHEAAVGTMLDDSFFKARNINPNTAVTCNCEWDAGHQETCDMVAAHDLRETLREGWTRQ